MRDPRTVSEWHITSPSPEDPQFPAEDGTQPSGRGYTLTDSERNTPQRQEVQYATPAQEQMRSNAPSPTSYWPSHLPREIAPISTAPPDFDNFNQDQETFGWADEEYEIDTDHQSYTPPPLDNRDYRGYTSAPHFYHQPFPLPDSPTYAGKYQTQTPAAHHPRRIQQYRPPSFGRYLMGGQNSPPRPGGSNDPPTDPPRLSNEERLQQAKEKLKLQDRRLAELKRELADQQAERDAHAELHQFDKKGKRPDREPPHVSNYRRPLYDRTDRWSVPRPPLKWQAPNPYPAPVRAAPDEAPWLGVKPLMVKPPLPFEGKYDNVERFIGDCFTYFEVFASYFQVPSSHVVFAVTHLEGPAKDWWVHARQDFWCNYEDDPEEARFRFPSWGEFTTLLAQNFHDPASEELHEKRMFDLRMGKGPAISYFQELEVEAKKANRRGETDARGLMVKAVRLGVPDSYTNAIANSGQHIPVTYNDWKRRICVMYEERQKKWVFNQTIGNRPAPKNSGSTTATSLPKTGGATSSTPAKQTGNSSAPAAGRDSSGRWTTHPGQGLPMSIDAQKLRNEGRCFRCKEKGHMSKDCPKKKEFRDIWSVQATTEPATGSKVEEDLHTGTLFNPISITTHSDTDFIATLSNIPRLWAPAFNVSSTTSTSVTESQNRYAALSVEECTDNDTNNDDTPLKGCHNTSPARAEAKAANPAGHEAESLSMRPLLTLGQTDANHRASSLCGETQSTNTSGEKSTLAVTPIDIASLPRMMDGTKGSSTGSSNEVSYRHDQAAQTLGSTIPKVDVESQLDGETTARLPGQERVPSKETTTPQQRPSPVGRPGKVMKVMTSQSPGAEGGGDAPVRMSPLLQRIVLVEANQTNLRSPIAPGNVDEERPSKTAGDANTTATKKTAAGLEAAGAQAVNRGHPTTIVEVPDEEDDTTYQIWLAKERVPVVVKKGDELSSVPTKKSDAQQWLKPFEVDWMLHAVCEARNDNAARAALYV
ncbi:uncharacterized protein ARMOST_07498 [Armillaria ostoyae]|uniref:CCHC-type domain-containing protein n=1 Tax=Armillaria ostoyae TaxID=47428 RepID=A0A284R5Z3_ARMOS|nr:uncharacterized protein ARMOST_07498 [Armillaria ostoyae]